MNSEDYCLTTDHAVSSYDIPVLVDKDGNTYGPQDTLPGGTPAWICAMLHKNMPGFPPKMVDRFIAKQLIKRRDK